VTAPLTRPFEQARAAAADRLRELACLMVLLKALDDNNAAGDFCVVHDSGKYQVAALGRFFL
jgi:hypothetical protein